MKLYYPIVKNTLINMYRRWLIKLYIDTDNTNTIPQIDLGQEYDLKFDHTTPLFLYFNQYYIEYIFKTCTPVPPQNCNNSLHV